MVVTRSASIKAAKTKNKPITDFTNRNANIDPINASVSGINKVAKKQKTALFDASHKKLNKSSTKAKLDPKKRSEIKINPDSNVHSWLENEPARDASTRVSQMITKEQQYSHFTPPTVKDNKNKAKKAPVLEKKPQSLDTDNKFTKRDINTRLNRLHQIKKNLFSKDGVEAVHAIPNEPL